MRLSNCFVQSSPFDENVPFYNKSITGSFSQPTDCALDFVKAATKMVSHILKKVLSIKMWGHTNWARTKSWTHL